LSLVLPFYPFYRKVIEERELEIRFGTSRREYPSNTPVLIPLVRCPNAPAESAREHD
jgi:protein-S-isoprenylcysteine O-methyltransferase Ste14